MNNSVVTDSTVNHSFNKKIGKANYRVFIYSSPTSHEDFNDKLLRVIKNDVTEKAVTTS